MVSPGLTATPHAIASVRMHPVGWVPYVAFFFVAGCVVLALDIHLSLFVNQAFLDPFDLAATNGLRRLPFGLIASAPFFILCLMRAVEGLRSAWVVFPDRVREVGGWLRARTRDYPTHGFFRADLSIGLLEGAFGLGSVKLWSRQGGAVVLRAIDHASLIHDYVQPSLGPPPAELQRAVAAGPHPHSPRPAGPTVVVRQGGGCGCSGCLTGCLLVLLIMCMTPFIASMVFRVQLAAQVGEWIEKILD